MIKSGYNQHFSFIESKRPKRLDFGMLDPEEVIRLSVANLENETIYDGITSMPSIKAINDPRMGTMNKDLLCLSCKGMQVDCPGHFGHIDLAKPVYHLGLIEYIRKILKCVCYNCSKLLAPRDKEKIE
jgi:DNA-directed RNA polymerase II subunit RPB1